MFLKLTIQLAGVSVLMSIGMNLIVKEDSENNEDFVISKISNWFDRAAL